MKHKLLNRFVEVCLLAGMALGVWLLYHLFRNITPDVFNFFLLEGKPAWFSYCSVAIGALCILGGELIALTLFCMMRSLDGDPFVEANVSALKRMGFTALAIALLGLCTLLLHPVPLAVIAALPTAMCGLFSLVLSRVFRQAVAFKQENDLTV